MGGKHGPTGVLHREGSCSAQEPDTGRTLVSRTGVVSREQSHSGYQQLKEKKNNEQGCSLPPQELSGSFVAVPALIRRDVL